MSFALDVKEELSRIELETYQERFAALEAILKNAAEISLGSGHLSLSLSSKSNAIIRYYIKLLTSFHKVDYSLSKRQVMRFDKPIIFELHIEDASLYVEDFNLMGVSHSRHEEILENKKEMSSYLRGAFIARGSLNKPDSKSHLEFALISNQEALFIQRILNTYQLNARVIKRKEQYVVYLKERAAICDALRIMGANESVFEIESKEITNKIIADTKRQLNFEVSNQIRTNKAAKNDLKYIHYLEMNYPLEKLDPKLLMVMKIRKENPEASLNELCVICKEVYNDNITKSGMNHRIRKLKEIALDYKNRR